jgi:SET domain-containing protein
MKRNGNIKFEIREIPGKGKGIFAKQFIPKGAEIFFHDLSKLPKFRLNQIETYLQKNPQLDGDHSDYAGNGFYVIDMSPASYMNHSCDPNCAYKFQTIARKTVTAIRNIEIGEELTLDYTACSIDQFDGNIHWILQCDCNSKNCRREVHGDFLQMPREWQKKFYLFLPKSIKRKFRTKFSL